MDDRRLAELRSVRQATECAVSALEDVAVAMVAVDEAGVADALEDARTVLGGYEHASVSVHGSSSLEDVADELVRALRGLAEWGERLFVPGASTADVASAVAFDLGAAVARLDWLLENLSSLEDF